MPGKNWRAKFKRDEEPEKRKRSDSGSESSVSFNLGSRKTKRANKSKKARFWKARKGQEESSQRLQNPEASPTCGNCGREDHRAAICVKAGVSGWMEACPKCDSNKHRYDQCPYRKEEEDFNYLIFNRQRKPPVKSTLRLHKIIYAETRRQMTKWGLDRIIQLPYLPKFARRQAQESPPEQWHYPHPDDPIAEASLRAVAKGMDSITLKVAAEIPFHEFHWSPAVERYDLMCDEDHHLPLPDPAFNPDTGRCAACDDHEGFHFPMECIKNNCPTRPCREPLLCGDHCDTCGWDLQEDAVLQITTKNNHVCLFDKAWSNNCDDQGNRIPILVCKTDREHRVVVDDKLQHRRHQTRAQFQTHNPFEAALKQDKDAQDEGSQKEGGQNEAGQKKAEQKDIEVDWPLECPHCIAEGYESVKVTFKIV